MNLTTEQDVYKHNEPLDYGPWTDEEMALLAGECAAILSGDCLDEPE